MVRKAWPTARMRYSQRRRNEPCVKYGPKPATLIEGDPFHSLVLKPRSHKWSMACTEIWVKDLEREREFYVDRLGFPVEEDQPGSFVMLRAGSTKLCIDKGKEREPALGGGASLFFKVKDIDTTAKELQNRGVSFKRTGDEYLEVWDPEGYKLLFTRSL